MLDIKPIEQDFLQSCIQKNAGKKNLLLLIDSGGSMDIYHPVVSCFVQAFEKAYAGRLEVDYFFNIPKRSGFSDITRMRRRLFKEEKYLKIDRDIIKEAINNQFNRFFDEEISKIIIISDAGSARGNYSDGRVEATHKAIQQLKNITDDILWFNPCLRKDNGYNSKHGIENSVHPIQSLYSNDIFDMGDKSMVSNMSFQKPTFYTMLHQLPYADVELFYIMEHKTHPHFVMSGI